MKDIYSSLFLEPIIACVDIIYTIANVITNIIDTKWHFIYVVEWNSRLQNHFTRDNHLTVIFLAFQSFTKSILANVYMTQWRL